MFYNDIDTTEQIKTVPNLIGYGLAEKFMFENGGTRSNTGVERINQSLRNLIQTPLGSRFFLPSFGSRIHELIFEPNDFIVRDLAYHYIKEAIDLWENRVNLNDVLVESEGNILKINVQYTIKDNSEMQSFVYDINREVKEIY